MLRRLEQLRDKGAQLIGLSSLEVTSSAQMNNHSGAMTAQTQTPVAKFLIGALVTLFLLCLLFPALHPWLAMVPGRVLMGPYSHAWTLFTAGYIEPDIFTGVLNIIAFALMGPLLERNYSSVLFLRFVIVINLALFTVVLISVIFFFAVTEEEHELYTHMCGSTGINAALLVALKQQFPERSLGGKWPIFKFKYLPFMFCTVTLSLWLMFNHIYNTQVVLAVYGTFVGWVYLRFFNVDPVTGVMGDFSHDFTFASLFPNIGPLQRLLTLISGKVFNTLKTLGCCSFRKKNTGLPVHVPLTGDSTGGATIPASPILNNRSNTFNNSAFGSLPPLTPQDETAERRRAVAMKLIEDKIARLGQNGPHDDSDSDDIDLDLSEFNLEAFEPEED